MKKLFFLITMVGLFAISSSAQNDGAGKGKPRQGQGTPHKGEGHKGEAHKGEGRKGGEARPKPTPDERAKRQTEHLNEVVGLNADQSAKIQAIHKAYIEKIQAVRNGNKKEELTEDQKVQIKDLQKARLAEIKAVLTKEQAQKFHDFKKKKQAEMKAKGERVPAEHEEPEDLKD